MVLSAAVRSQTPERTSASVIQLADRGPVFYTASSASARHVDVRMTSVFRKRVSIHLHDVPLGTALDDVARQAGLAFGYAKDAIPRVLRVSLSADNITVASALNELLLDTGLDVSVGSADFVSLLPHALFGQASSSRAQAPATIAGRVTDAGTHIALDQVAVRVEGAGFGAVTASDGRYTIHNVPSGTYRVTARRVGYTPLTKTVAVVTDSAAMADFALLAAPTRLNEMVTTAVGEQRRYEVGNTISTINADSISPTAPITSLTDLISARAPGVEVLETSGMTGAGEAIRIRGRSSLVLQNDPILIVDGVRQDNSAGGDVNADISASQFFGTHPTPTRLNDLNFSDIESIDILKGPAASTEYGTDAANGVIVITTKHGTAGTPQWKLSAEQTESNMPVTFANGYYSWGHLTDGTHTPVNCPLFPVFGAPASTAGTCAVDSVTQWNPLNHAATSIFGTGHRGKYDLSVSGGTDAVRYFVSGGLSNETGVIQMPPVFRTLADTANLGVPSSALNPNTEQQRSVRVNTAIRLGPTADLAATGSYLSTYQQTPNAYTLYYGVYIGPALSDPAHYYGYDHDVSEFTPISQLTETGSQNTGRVTGGLTGSWRPAPWFAVHATAGLDHGSQRNEEIDYPLTNPRFEYSTPFLAIADATTDVYSVDLRGTATASLMHDVRAVTSGGVQMVDARTAGQATSVQGITATNPTLNGSTAPIATQQANRQATFGGYGEEQLSIADRIFLTGALRIDAGSAFGRAYATAAYPKASVSWLALGQGRTTLRIRGAFGESGVQPMNGAAATLYAPSVAYLGGATITTYRLNWPGNTNLRPERSAEVEGGIDLGGWGNRVSAELTAYSKTTHDALVNVNLTGTLCCYTYQENVGEVRNTGLEGSMTVGLLQGRPLTWDIALNASINRNRLISLSPGVIGQTVTADVVQYRQAPGYPLYGVWAHRVTYADANHDGIIEPSEVTAADSATYVGPSLPTQEASVSTHLGFWQGAVTVSGLVDYRGGYRIANAQALYSDYAGRLRGENDPKAPLWLQARAIEDAAFVTNSLMIEDGTFVRVREVSATYALPRSVVRLLRVRSLSLTGAVRNLALWTRYSGADPEVSNTIGYNIQPAPTSGGSLVNSDVRADEGAVPLMRYWVVRLNAGL